MDKRKIFFIIFTTIVLIYSLGRFFNVSKKIDSIKFKYNLNDSQQVVTLKDGQKIKPGYYNVKNNSVNNSGFKGEIFSPDSEVVNIYIADKEVENELELTPANSEDNNYMGKDDFEASCGYYEEGLTIDQGVYKVNPPQEGDEIHITSRNGNQHETIFINPDDTPQTITIKSDDRIRMCEYQVKVIDPETEATESTVTPNKIKLSKI